MQNHDKSLIGGDAVENKSFTEDGTRPEPIPATSTRKDKHQLHVTRHAVLSRHPLEALAGAGENIRELRRLERALRAQLQPRGIIAELLFDRCWSCFLKCLLIARAEKNLFEAENKSFEERILEANTIALAGGQPKNDSDFFKNLSIIQRYDSHYSREFFKTLAMLLAIRGTGQAGLARVLGKAFAQGKDAVEETDE
jgi:hypothetical protein